ncbi:tRNA (guanine46-N7-)-methyltransferase [Actinomycetales bacterium JB111]|nr:tRNA (guanine46-N7-)-methyltransferase [Actinomycetales bacterium JB111]
MSTNSRRVAIRPSDLTGADGERPAGHARVRSFTRRGSRLNERQATVWAERGEIVLDLPTATSTTIPDDTVLDLAGAFGRDDGRLVVEIGCGAGEQLAHAAAAAPEDRFLGVEVWLPGLVRTLGRVKEAGSTNVRLAGVDAAQALPILLPAGSVDEVWTFFPDPWPKSRHHKRRIVDAAFAATIARLLAPGGVWRLATDWADYADQMVEVLRASEDLELTVEPERWSGRTLTRFERRGRREGRVITDLTAVRRDG